MAAVALSRDRRTDATLHEARAAAPAFRIRNAVWLLHGRRLAALPIERRSPVLRSQRLKSAAV